MDNEKLKHMIKKLFALKSHNPDPFVVQCWMEVLQKFDIDKIAKAFNACLQKDGFFEIKMVLDELQSNDKVIGYEAWDVCLECARRGGEGFDGLNEKTKTALHYAGGMDKLRMADERKTEAMRKIFLECCKPENIDRKLIQ